MHRRGALGARGGGITTAAGERQIFSARACARAVHLIAAFSVILLFPRGAAAQTSSTHSSSAWELPPPPADEHLEYEADHLDYSQETSELHLSGNVRVKESTATIRASELWLDTKRRTGRAEGRLLVDDGVSAVYGEGGTFDFERHTGVLTRAKAGHGNWRVTGRSVEMGTGRRVDYRGANFTACSLDPRPHYHFRATSLTVVPKKHLIARNAVFYLGRVPIFYFPFLYHSLKDRHVLRFRVQPGYDRRSGGYLKGTLTTGHGPDVTSKLFVDYYTAQGLGLGGELIRHQGADSRGGLFGYRIRETHNGQERWGLFGDGYQALSSSFSAQGRLQVQSDADFNNHYARSSLFRVTPELLNSGAVVYRNRTLTTRLSYDRRDVADESRTKFLKDRESYPRLDVLTSPLTFWRLPWLNTFSAFADNNYQRDRPYLERRAGGEWEITRTVNLARGLSLTPKLAYGQTYLSRYDQLTSLASTSTVLDAFVGRYRAEGNLRLNSPVGAWDLQHFYKMRQRPDEFAEDAGALDYGVETNLTALQDTYRPTRNTLLRVGSGYDWRRFRDHRVGFRERVQPLFADVVYTPRYDLALTLRDEYRLEGGNTSLIADGRYGDSDGNFLGASFSYNDAQPQNYYASTEFGVRSSSDSLQLGGAFRGLAASSGGPGRLHSLSLFEKELFVAKRWHDFYTRVLGRLRPGGVKEVQIRVELVLPAFTKKEAPRDWEREWFPARRKMEGDRP